MNERKVTLPSGGSAWIVERWPHGLATTVRRHHLRIAQFFGSSRDGENALRRDLTEEEREQYTTLLANTETLYVRTFTTRWDVTGPDGTALTFPDDIDAMDEHDFAALTAAILERRADPNAGEPPSESSSEPASSPPTPISAKTSSRS